MNILNFRYLVATTKFYIHHNNVQAERYILGFRSLTHLCIKMTPPGCTDFTGIKSNQTFGQTVIWYIGFSLSCLSTSLLITIWTFSDRHYNNMIKVNYQYMIDVCIHKPRIWIAMINEEQKLMPNHDFETKTALTMSVEFNLSLGTWFLLDWNSQKHLY